MGTNDLLVCAAYCVADTSSAKVRVDLLVLDANNQNRISAAVPGSLK